MSPGSKGPVGQSLEEEQRFYIQQLFRRYGQKDRLDFQGFQSLLFSLGLGSVKVVDMDHEDLGHDHVAHLDLLDIKDGLHSHSSAPEHHSQGHGHPHTEQVPTQCTQQTTAASPAAGGPTGHGHEHDHDHAMVEDSDHKHSDGQVQDEHDHDHDHAHDKEHKHEQVKLQSNHKDLSSQPHSGHDHSGHNPVQTGTDITPINHAPSLLEPSQVPQESQSSPATTESRPKKQRKPARARGQRGRDRTSSPLTPLSDDHQYKHSHDHDHSHGHSHSHKEKREAPGEPVTTTLSVPVLPVHPGGLSHQHEEVRLV